MMKKQKKTKINEELNKKNKKQKEHNYFKNKGEGRGRR